LTILPECIKAFIILRIIRDNLPDNIYFWHRGKYSITMSRRDTYHDVVKEMLIKEGWTVTHDPYIFRTDPRLAADLGAERLIAAERKCGKIVVGIKSFLRTSQVVDLEEAVGKYSIYSIFLQQHEPDRRLWVAVPLHASENILSGRWEGAPSKQ
jgi:hypothetical protein